MTKVYIHGADNIGWSIDSDRCHLEQQVKLTNYTLTNSWWQADIIHNIWWNKLAKTHPIRLIVPKIFLVTCSNFVQPDSPTFEPLLESYDKVQQIAHGWICPSRKQQNILNAYGHKTYWHPFSIDLNKFGYRKIHSSREDLYRRYKIPQDRLNGKLIIGSFQRDSPGANLSEPKWQKNPQLLVDLLKDQDPEKYILLLAGPRRHYILNACKENRISYIYLGTETNSDDLLENAVPYEDMPGLYKMVDQYLVTSASEGGPKAVLESIATQTACLSTNVGFSADFLDAHNIFDDELLYKEKVTSIINDGLTNMDTEMIKSQYAKLVDIIGPKQITERLNLIYEDILLS